jgi:hypothetical protein
MRECGFLLPISGITLVLVYFQSLSWVALELKLLKVEKNIQARFESRIGPTPRGYYPRPPPPAFLNTPQTPINTVFLPFGTTARLNRVFFSLHCKPSRVSTTYKTQSPGYTELLHTKRFYKNYARRQKYNILGL